MDKLYEYMLTLPDQEARITFRTEQLELEITPTLVRLTIHWPHGDLVQCYPIDLRNPIHPGGPSSGKVIFGLPPPD